MAADLHGEPRADAPGRLTRQRWTASPVLALGLIVLTWAGLFWGTWAHWGDVTVDSGREVYVPAVLATGRTLYRDVWYLYNPLAPYFNSALFQIFGTRLETAYWAGSLSALGSAVFLMLGGMRCGSLPAGWTAAMLVLLQGFLPSLFCFPFPYSFAAAYALLASCGFLWASVGAFEETGRGWLSAAAWFAAVGLLLKLEYGMALYGGLGMLLLERFTRDRNLRRLTGDLASLAPSVLVVLAVVWWMVGLRGLDFLLHENMMSWPTSYFMQTYGATWMSLTMNGGEPIDHARTALLAAAYLAFWLSVRAILASTQQERLGPQVASVVFAGAALLLFSSLASRTSTGGSWLHWLFLPKFSPLLAGGGAILALLAWARGAGRPALLITGAGAFSVLLCLRLLNGILPYGYSIFYSAPLIACMVFMLAWVVTPRGPDWSRDFLRAQWVLGILLLLTMIRQLLPLYLQGRDAEAISTPRGQVYTSPARALGYREALDFIARQTAAGERVLSVPEDTTLYFLSGTASPTRVYTNLPGALAPGKMTQEYIAELERAGVNYILWSNRSFPEYGASEFGTDFDRPVGDYIRQNFVPEGDIPETEDAGVQGWRARIWRRKTSRN